MTLKTGDFMKFKMFNIKLKNNSVQFGADRSENIISVIKSESKLGRE